MLKALHAERDITPQLRITHLDNDRRQFVIAAGELASNWRKPISLGHVADEIEGRCSTGHIGSKSTINCVVTGVTQQSIVAIVAE